MHIRRGTFLIIVLPFLLATIAAYIQWLMVGLPPVLMACLIPRTSRARCICEAGEHRTIFGSLFLDAPF
jgi:hypothetical protein